VLDLAEEVVLRLREVVVGHQQVGVRRQLEVRRQVEVRRQEVRQQVGEVHHHHQQGVRQ
jgi:hypothetical protein